MSEERVDFLKFCLTVLLILTEYWAMQPYQVPLFAAMWRRLMLIFQKLAYLLGRAAITAEHNYYTAVEAGI